MNTECVSTFYIVSGLKNRRIVVSKKKNRVVYHVLDTCLFKRHLLYDVRNAPGTLVREHFSDKHVLRIHLLYDVKNASSTLER